MREVTECHASYLRDAFERTDEVIERIAKALQGKEFDTIVGSGISGAILLFKLRDRFKCHVAVVRKRNDGTHSAQLVEGTIGKRYVVVDDQVASGSTVKRIISQIEKQLSWYIGAPSKEDLPTFVGVACYCHTGPFCGIEQWIDGDDDRFVPYERKSVKSTDDYSQEQLYGMADTATSFSNTLTADSSRTTEQILSNAKIVWDKLVNTAEFNPPKSRAPFDQRSIEWLTKQYGGSPE